MRALRIATALALSAGAAGVARAEPKAVILPTTWRNVAGETERITLVGSIAATVAAQGYELIDDRLRDATLEGDKRLAECIEKIPCKLELAERLNADVAVSSTVQRGPGKGRAEWLVTIALLPIDVRRLGSTDLRRCGSCTVVDLEPIITSLVGEVFAAERKRARAKLVVRVRGGVQASVLLDGEPCGATELSRTIYTGSHVVRVEGDGRACERKIEATAGAVIELEADLERRVLARPGERGAGGGRGAPRWLRPLGLVAVAVGLAAAAGGIGLLAIDGRGTCSLVPPAEHCPERYATLGSGLSLTIVGGAVAVAGAVMALLPRAPERVAVAPLVGPGSAGLSLAGRF